MKKIVLVVAHKDYRDEEYELTRKALEEADVSVSVASTDISDAKGVKGGSVKVDILLSNIQVSDFDGIAFIGGPGSKNYMGHAIALNLIREFMSKDKAVGAICFAPAILAEAGVLSEKRATGWELDGLPEIIESNGGIYVYEPVVVDGKVVTAIGPSASYDFGKTIASMLSD
jgi:protease I